MERGVAHTLVKISMNSNLRHLLTSERMPDYGKTCSFARFLRVLPMKTDPLRRADEGTRTPNLLITNELLYQLSYVSMHVVLEYARGRPLFPTRQCAVDERFAYCLPTVSSGPP